jgi:hypothetical protein
MFRFISQLGIAEFLEVSLKFIDFTDVGANSLDLTVILATDDLFY